MAHVAHQLRRLGSLLAAAALVGGLAAPAGGDPGYASSEDVQRRLEQARRQVAEAAAREQAARQGIARTDARRRALEAEIAALTSRVRQTQAQLDGAEQRLGAVLEALAAKEAELAQALDRLQAARDLVRSRASRLYKLGPVSVAGLLVGAHGFRDLAERFVVMSRVFGADERAIRLLAEARDRVAAQRAELDALRLKAEGQVAEVASERRRLASQRGGLEARRRELAAELARQQATLEDAQEDKAAYLRQVRELEEESRRIAAFLRGRSGGKPSVAPGGMQWPTEGPVSSGFGWRTHPIFGDRRFHTGIDIAAPAGQAVVAAAAGTVIDAGPKGGYGNVVIVDHGGGLATLYAHLSSVVVAKGSAVRQGGMVGRVGCSGYCTAPHLHFEVRVDGQPQDPMRWL